MTLSLLYSDTLVAGLTSLMSRWALRNHARSCSLICSGDRNFSLSTWIGGLKRAMSIALKSRHLWQPAFFDHILRSDESYAEKWDYVRHNPVRAGFVKAADDWLYQEEIVVIDRA